MLTSSNAVAQFLLLKVPNCASSTNEEQVGGAGREQKVSQGKHISQRSFTT